MSNLTLGQELAIHADQSNVPMGPNGLPGVRLADGSIVQGDAAGNPMTPEVKEAGLDPDITVISSTVPETGETIETKRAETGGETLAIIETVYSEDGQVVSQRGAGDLTLLGMAKPGMGMLGTVLLVAGIGAGAYFLLK